MKSHYVTRIEETDEAVIAHVDRISARRLRCSHCAAQTSRTYGRGSPRLWRDLSLRDHPLLICYAPYRLMCRCCRAVKTERVPWAHRWARVTTALASAVAVMARRESWSEVAHHFRLDWKTVTSIVRFAVAFGLKHRPWKPLHFIGVDEVSRKRGHRYLTVVYDLERGRVVWIGDDRKKETLDQFFRWLGPRKRRSIQVVSCDMWAPYAQSVEEHAPQALIVFDRFHLTQHLLDAVDEVRRQQMRRLNGADKKLIKGTRFVLLKNPWNLTDKQAITLSVLIRLNAQLIRAYLLKEAFRQFWDYRSPAWAAQYLKCWLWWANHSRLEPFKKFVRLVKAHLDGILAWTLVRLSNGALEGINNIAACINNAILRAKKEEAVTGRCSFAAFVASA